MFFITPPEKGLGVLGIGSTFKNKFVTIEKSQSVEKKAAKKSAGKKKFFSRMLL
jgi:hypothetical protein